MSGDCKNCANMKNCTKMIGIVWGWCATGFVPKKKEEAKA